MDESSSSFLPPKLPAKRNRPLGQSINADQSASYQQEQATGEALPLNNALPVADEITPELLTAYVQQMKEDAREAVIDLPIAPKESRVMAPILQDYIDPHTVPFQYLLEQTRPLAAPEDLPQEHFSAESEATPEA